MEPIVQVDGEKALESCVRVMGGERVSSVGAAYSKYGGMCWGSEEGFKGKCMKL